MVAPWRTLFFCIEQLQKVHQWRTIEGFFLNTFAKGLTSILATTVCDGIINLQINKSTCDFSQIFLLDIVGLAKTEALEMPIHLYVK